MNGFARELANDYSPVTQFKAMKFLITNSVPLNGGDETLLRSLIRSLNNRWPDADITVLCRDLELCRKQLPDLRLGSDLEFAKTAASRSATLQCYRDADIVLSAPGGFLHDFYTIEERLRGFEVALEMSKPVVLVGQSIGPFWKSKSIKRVGQVLNRVSRICLRDEISSRHLAECGVDSSIVTVTADLAFLWHKIAPELFKPKFEAPTRLVGMSFRRWGDKGMLKQTIAKAERLCRHILEDGNKRILFLSTCQGISGYTDDSEIALQICDRLPAHLRLRCDIDRSRYRPEDLIQAFGQCDAFIGMRLHACVLAMLAGVPAMGLGYEDKTEQIFRQMGLELYQTRFDTDLDAWILAADRFLADLPDIRGRLANALSERCQSAQRNIAAIAEELPALPLSAATTPELQWSQSVKRYGRPHLRLRQVAALVNELKPKRMLDIGCATGHLRMLCPGVEYTGIDFVAQALPAFSFFQCNFNREPLPMGLSGFDVVVCSGILEYIEDLPAFLASVRSALAPGGRLVVTYFNMNHISRIGALMLGRSFPVHPDWRGFRSPKDFRNLLEKCGFQVVKSIASSQSLGASASVEETVSAPLTLTPVHWWSTLLAHQFLFTATLTAETRSSSNVPSTESIEHELV